MSNYPYQTVVVQKESNNLAVIGFCMMLLGYLTCGLLCIPSMFVCGAAMYKEPRGLAIAGFILSIPAVIGFFVFMFFFAAAGIMGTGIVQDQQERDARRAAWQKSVEKSQEMIKQQPIEIDQ